MIQTYFVTLPKYTNNKQEQKRNDKNKNTIKWQPTNQQIVYQTKKDKKFNVKHKSSLSVKKN